MTQKTDSALKSTLILTVLSGISQLIGFFYRVCLSRTVGAQVMGLYQLLMPVYSVFISLTAVGVTAAVSNLTPQYLALNNLQGVKKTLRLALASFFVLMIPLAVGVFLFSDEISVSFLGDARTQLGIIFLVPCVFLTGIENIHKHVFFGAGKVVPPAIADIAEQVLRIVFVLGLLFYLAPPYAEKTAGTIILGMTLCEVFSALCLRTICCRFLNRMPVSQGRGESYPVLFRKLSGIAVPAGATALLANMMGAANAAILPQLLIARGASRADAMTQFGMVCGMILPLLGLPTVLLGALNRVLMPKLTHHFTLGNNLQMKRQLEKAIFVTSATMLPAMILFTVLGSDVGSVLFKQNLVQQYFPPLAAAMTLSCFQAVFSVGLNAISKQSVSAFISIFCDGLELLLTIALVPIFGMKGFVMTLFFIALIETVSMFVALCKFSKMKISFIGGAYQAALASLLMGLTSNLLYLFLRRQQLSMPLSSIATAGYAIVIFLVAMQSMGVLQKRD